MSVGTMVTIVLLMIVLVLGIFFIQKIFSGGSDAIDSINSQVQSQIQKLFSQEGTKVAVYPTSRDITIKKGDTPKGFAFSVKNLDSASFSYSTAATDVSQCGSSFTIDEANSYLLGGSGNFDLGPGNQLDLPVLIRLEVPSTAPPCTIIYTVNIKEGSDSYATIPNIAVTIK